MNEKIEKLLNDLSEAVKETWGGTARCSVNVHPDGYQSILIDEWECNPAVPIEAWKRRELYESWRYIGYEWNADRSEIQNDYYRQHNCLLKKGLNR